MRQVLFVCVAICAAVFLFSVDRWGQKAFIKIVLSAAQPKSAEKTLRHRHREGQDFPENFLIGTASSAYQVEGGWNAKGKTPSIWDDFVHFDPKTVVDNSTGDIGCDSFHNYQEDIAALKLVGFQHYRFSISWARIIPYGSSVNQNGIDHYAKLIDELIANDIEPIVTIFHWDVPTWLDDLGGLTNPLFVDYFRVFVDVLFKNFGSKVKIWITINEPYNFCINGYGQGNWAPGVHSPGVGEYLCGHHLLLAHAAAFHLYKDKYFDEQRGRVSITLDSQYYYAKDSSVTKEDLHRAQVYRLGWFAHPLFSKEGGYPPAMVDEIGRRCKLEGRAFSRLPEMDDATKVLVRGSSDFFGINYYTSRLLSVDRTDHNLSDSPAWFKDAKSQIHIDPKWKHGKSEWLYSVPEGLRDLLIWIKNEYDNPPVFITENGWSDEGELEDYGRIGYLRSHLAAVSKAINEDNCNVIGYTAWSLLDSFEWDRGYTEKFGIFSVNFTSPRRERTAKMSAMYLKEVIKNRKL